MSFAEFENTWHSPRNRPSVAQLEELKMKFVTDLNRRRRGLVYFLGMVGAVLAVITVALALHLISPDSPRDAIDPAREWAALAFLLLPWAGWGAMLRHYLRHRAAHRDYDRSIHASVQAALDENRMERSRYKLISLLQGLTLAILPLVIYQLRAAGKAGDEIVVPAFVLFPLILLGIFLASTYRYRVKLLPRKRELEELLAAYK